MGMAQLMENPEVMRSMMNPTNLRTMMSMQNTMSQLQQQQSGAMPTMNMGPSSSNTTTPSAATGSNNPNLDFSSLLNQFNSATSLGAGTGGMPPSPWANMAQPQQPRPPQERFRVQLQSLRDMGFEDEDENIQILQQNHGNLNRAVDQLIMGGGSTSNAPAPAPAAAQPPLNENDNNDTSASPPEP